MPERSELPTLPFPSAEAWEAWLAEHHEAAPGIWLKLAKKGSGIRSVTFKEALDVALCYGWIDGQARSVDDTFYVQRFVPRRPRSTWSKRNRENVARLAAAGRMRPAGLRQVELAKADGRWDAAYDSPSTATVPDDLQRELDASPAAAEQFAALDGQNRYAILHRIQTARKPDTRARRIEAFVAMLNEGRKPLP